MNTPRCGDWNMTQGGWRDHGSEMLQVYIVISHGRGSAVEHCHARGNAKIITIITRTKTNFAVRMVC